ncbi:unnamed protein product [Alternaria alternata]
MSWAAGRQTKRKEDAAYCLLGLFNVHMPLIYCEGDQAFQRLQEEIVKRHNNITVFAWDPLEEELHNRDTLGLFASSPANFAKSFAIRPFTDVFIEFSTTNKGVLFTSGIRLRTDVVEQPGNGGAGVLYLFCLGIDFQWGGGERQRHTGIYLRKLGPRLYRRVGNIGWQVFLGGSLEDWNTLDVVATHILIDPMVAMTNVPFLYRRSSVHVPCYGDIQVQAAYPDNPMGSYRQSLYVSKVLFMDFTPRGASPICSRMRHSVSTGMQLCA